MIKFNIWSIKNRVLRTIVAWPLAFITFFVMIFVFLLMMIVGMFRGLLDTFEDIRNIFAQQPWLLDDLGRVLTGQDERKRSS